MKNELLDLPYMLYADPEGRIYEHPTYRMAGFSGGAPMEFGQPDLIPMPEFSKLFFVPDCPPIGRDPVTGQCRVVAEDAGPEGKMSCFAVAAFLEPGYIRSLLPAVDYQSKSYTLPTWAYTAVGFKEDRYWVPAFRVEYNHRWDPHNYDDRDLIPAIEEYRRHIPGGRLVEHLVGCATGHHCFAAKNLFLKRWEAPLPVSRNCNAHCLGCLSHQEGDSCEASHQRIRFKPRSEEIVALAVNHLKQAREAIASFGQGCEGEPLTEYRLIRDCIAEIRRRTDRGTINLNTNGSSPEKIRSLAASGLDSIRISINSARSELYHAYYRPQGYRFEDVVASIRLSKQIGLYTMLNYLVFPGISDQREEFEALRSLIERTGVDFIHLKNLNIDPPLYIRNMPSGSSPPVGMGNLVAALRGAFPHIELGYFNRALR
jgi:pyruvate-formate lyase-activating enzyme